MLKTTVKTKLLARGKFELLEEKLDSLPQSFGKARKSLLEKNVFGAKERTPREEKVRPMIRPTVTQWEKGTWVVAGNKNAMVIAGYRKENVVHQVLMGGPKKSILSFTRAFVNVSFERGGEDFTQEI